MFSLGAGLTLLGMASLALAQDRHARVLIGSQLKKPWLRIVRGTGTSSLIAGAAIGCMGYGYGVGLVTYLAWATVAAWIIALLIAWRRKVLQL